MGRPVRRVPGVGVGRRGGGADGPGRGRPGQPARPCRSAQVSVAESAFRTSGVPELDRVLGGGLVPGRRDPARRRARRRQEHAAARGGRPDRPLPAPHPLRHRRGVRLPGPAARRPHRRRPRRALPRRRDRPRRRAHPHRGGAPELLVVDSIQTIGAAGVDGVPGGVTQVKEVAAALIRVAKTRNITTVLVGHVTKDGSIAGPRVLEHLVDVVLALRGRPQLPLPDGPGDEEPLRPDRRGRLLRPRPPTASPRSPTRPACSWSTTSSRSPAPASR